MCDCTKNILPKIERNKILNELFSKKVIFAPYTIIDIIKDFLTGNLIKVSKSIQDVRLEICSECEYRAFKSHCSKSGCLLSLKVQFLRSVCPMGKWS